MQPCPPGKGSYVYRQQNSGRMLGLWLLFPVKFWLVWALLSADVSNPIYWVTEASRRLSVCEEKEDRLVFLHGLQSGGKYFISTHVSKTKIVFKMVFPPVQSPDCWNIPQVPLPVCVPWRLVLKNKIWCFSVIWILVSWLSESKVCVSTHRFSQLFLQLAPPRCRWWQWARSPRAPPCWTRHTP